MTLPTSLGPGRFLACAAIAAMATAATAAERDMHYTAGKWDNRKLGNHRAVLRVAEADASAPAVRAHIPWRRRDANPQAKAIIVTDAKDKPIANAVAVSVTQPAGDVVFQPVAGAGEYHVYFLPASISGRAFARGQYLAPKDTADAAWRKRVGLSGDDDANALPALPAAEVASLQSASEFDRFTDMELTATPRELADLLAKHDQQTYLVFPEDRAHPIRMTDNLPARWVQAGPRQVFRATARPNEYYAFQLGVFAARQPLKDVRVRFSDLLGNQRGVGNEPAIIRVPALTCFNTGGTDWMGRPMNKTVDVPAGKVQAMWCGIDIPTNARPGTYRGTVTVQPAGQKPRKIAIELKVAGEILADRGDSDPALHSRLRWLNSTIALDDHPTAGFPPVRQSGRDISCLGRTVTLGPAGLPERIVSTFSASVTRTDAAPRDILAAPVNLTVVGANAKPLKWTARSMKFTDRADGVVRWTGNAKAGPLTMTCEASMEFDGFLNYRVAVSAASKVDLDDIRLEIPYRPGAARYMMGMGVQGGIRPKSHEWKWDPAKHQDSVWIGDVNAGLRCQLKGENYRRPLVNIHYRHLPLKMPPAWYNDGRGRCTVSEQADRVVLWAAGGPRTLEAGQTLHFDFTLLVTPFRPLNTRDQWATRYYQKYHAIPAPAKIKANGANVINIHHACAINPYINYPFLTADGLRKYVKSVHDVGLKVKLYYTVRELTDHVPELWALRSLGDEVLAHGPGGGDPWLDEHIGPNYIQAWCEPTYRDAAIITAGMSRWHNYYLEGLDWLCRNVRIDGLYIDDVAYDRTVMKRARKILDRDRPGSLIDLHSWNEFNGRAGYANCANLYMESLPYIDRIWFGEGFDYNRTSPDYWLVEMSGIPFGVMSEMLPGGGNPKLGMVFGETGRLGWGGDPREMWKFWDAFGMAETEMIGYWDPACPVKTSDPLVLATVYRKKGKALVAIASWAKNPADVTLTIDFKSLGLDPAKTTLATPAIEGFQKAQSFAIDKPIPVQPRNGWLLVLTES